MKSFPNVSSQAVGSRILGILLRGGDSLPWAPCPQGLPSNVGHECSRIYVQTAACGSLSPDWVRYVSQCAAFSLRLNNTSWRVKT